MQLVYFVLVGGAAGLISSKILNIRGSLLMVLFLGILGGFVGGWALAQFGLVLPGGVFGELATAALGGMVLLYLYKLVRIAPR